MVNSRGAVTKRRVPRPKPTSVEIPATSTGGPHRRRRVTRACDQCRATRERCDGSQPDCETCTSHGRPCSYNEKARRRGIPPNYIRTLELTLSWVFVTFPHIEKAATIALSHEDSDLRWLLESTDSGETEKVLQSWRNSLVSQVLTGTSVDTDGSMVSDSAQLVEQKMRQGLAKHAEQSDDTPVPDRRSSTTNESIGNTALQSELPAATAGAESEPHHQLPNNAWTLLDHYFAFTHDWLPMVEKHSILKVMYSYPSEGLTKDQMSTAEHAELWSIMALSASQISDSKNPDEVSHIRSLADSLIPSGAAAYEGPHLKAMILRALDELQQGHVLAAWLRIGVAVRLLLLFPLLEDLGQTEKRCAHVHLAAYAVESALAQRLRTSSHLRPEYITVIGFVKEDGLDEWSIWTDPLRSETSDGAHEIRKPAKSFSTLNTLVRYFGDAEVFGKGAKTNARIEIVPQLLENSKADGWRVQPSMLVASLIDKCVSQPIDG